VLIYSDGDVDVLVLFLEYDAQGGEPNITNRSIKENKQ